MRNVTLLIVLFLTGWMALPAQSPESAGSATDIRFEISGMPQGYCRIIGMVGDQNYLADSVLSQNGVAHLKRDKPLDAGLFYFVFPDRRTFVQFLADKDQEFVMKTERNNLVGSMKVEGSLDNELFYRNQQFEARWRQSYDSTDAAIKAQPTGSMNLAFLENKKDALLAARKIEVDSYAKDHPESFYTIFKIAGQNPDLTYPKKENGTIDTLLQLVNYRDAYWNGVDLGDIRLLRTPVVSNKLTNYITKLTPQVPDSIVKYADRVVRLSMGDPEVFKFIVNWIAIKYEKPEIMGGEKILVHLVDNFFTDELVTWYKDKPEELKKIRKKVADMRPSMIGKVGQDLRCKNINGDYETLYGMGSPIKVLWMYSYTCSHCKERSPVMAQILREWKAKGIDVYALCLDPEEDKWKEFVKKYDMEEFHNVIDPNYESRYYKKYHVDITPEAFVLDQNNIIIAKDLHPNQLPPVFEKALKK